MSQPIYAAFTGNTLKILPLSPYRDIIPEGTVINGFPDGIRGSVGVKLVKIEDGVFERVFFDLDGTKNTEYYPVKVTTADIGDGHPLIIRKHLTNDESCLWLNDLLDGPEKYLRGEFEKTRRNEPARFVFMRKYEYPDDMYEIHNPETKKCNVIDVSTGQLMFPEWCDSVEFRDGKWSRSNTPRLEGIDALAQAFVESESDGRMLRIATDIATQFFSGDTLKQIVDKLNDMESLSVFGKDEDFYVTKEIKEPVHLVIQAFLGYDPSHEQRSGVTFYGNPPKITLYLSDTTGRLRGSYNKSEHVRNASAQDVIQRWKSTAIHEIAHALDQVLRGSTSHGRNTKSSLRQTGDYRYANDLLETNARIPQIARMMCENLIARREFDGNAVPPIQTILKFFNDSIMSFSAMSEDTRKRTMKRIHDIYSKIAPVWKAHADEIKDADDFMKFLGGEGKDTCGIGDILGNGATVQLANGSVLKLRREADGTYTVIGGSYEGDVGTKITFDPKASYDPHLKTKALRTVKVERKDGKVYNSLPLTAKSVTPLHEGIDALAQAFTEAAQTRFVTEDDLKKYASDEDIDKYANEVEMKKLHEKAPEKKSGLVLVPADLVAIVARRMQAAAEYDGLNYVIDPDGLELHLDNGYMTGKLSYDTHREALVSPTANGTYPLDDNTDLDWITKKILADMDPERFEEKIAGKYDEGRDLVTALAGTLRSKAERMGRKFSFREDGYKLSVENKETGDNYSSTVLEYDPEAKELKGKDGGSSFRLDDGTNIRKLASEIFNRTETMDL